MTFYSGFIAIVGPPNAGKSTLLNQLIGSKLAIVSPKPQTTRNRILGVYNEKDYQIIFTDTPGIHRSFSPLHRSMVASAEAAMAEVDLILLVIDALHAEDPETDLAINYLKKNKRPAFLAINKIDLIAKEALLPLLKNFRDQYPFETIIPISALQGDGIAIILAEIKKRIVPGPAFFPPDMQTDQSESIMIAETIREKIYLHTKKELPYACAVTIEEAWESQNKELLIIKAKIHVERESQRGILIGRSGQMIKTIGQSARKELEKLFATKIYLELMVRVEKNWTHNPKALKKLGY